MAVYRKCLLTSDIEHEYSFTLLAGKKMVQLVQKTILCF